MHFLFNVVLIDHSNDQGHESSGKNVEEVFG